MGNILSAIRDDIEEYVELCKMYNEEVQYSHGSEDCYGKHAKELKDRRDHDYQRSKVCTPGHS